MTRIGQVAIEIYMMGSVLSRASRAVTEDLYDCEAEHHAVKTIVEESLQRVKDLVYEIERSPYYTNDIYSERIHDKNMKYGGYFAFSPLDKLHY